MKCVTLGAYGFTESTFFDAIRHAQVDTFCDLRWRRGVRGAEYAFVNSARLQKRLFELGVRYIHFRELAPSPALRQRQFELDEAEGIAKRKRLTLSETFIAGYQQELAARFNSREFLERLGTTLQVMALFCVETEPGACHRSLLAERLRQDLGEQIEIAHLRP